jgi:isocitrate dehydrogenase
MNTKRTIAVANGDGIGKEIMDACLHIFNAAGVPLEYEFVEMGKEVFLAGLTTGMTDAAKASVEKHGILFKGPMETPKGTGGKSINVTARKVWSTYANRRQVRTLPGVETVFSKAGIPIDITIVRENIEDTYGGIEHMLTHDVALCRRFITRPGSEQIVRYAFEMAKREGYTQVACGHKANIMKLTDGLFLKTFYEIAKEYPGIEAKDIIVDDLCMKLASKPQLFQVIVLPNLQGDIVSDLCAGLVGGLGFAPSANIGDNISIFEAVHGTAPDIAGQQKANPTALLMSGLLMLRHLGLSSYADTIQDALIYTLESGVHTPDFGTASNPASSTGDFASAIASNLGKKPANPARTSGAGSDAFNRPPAPAGRRMMESPAPVSKLVGIDFFVESNQDGSEVANTLMPILPAGWKITTISNRGTQVWPTGSLYTECINQYRLRIESDQEISQKQVFEFCGKVSEKYYICTAEMLRYYGEERGYSLAQGQ